MDAEFADVHRGGGGCPDKGVGGSKSGDFLRTSFVHDPKSLRHAEAKPFRHLNITNSDLHLLPGYR